MHSILNTTKGICYICKARTYTEDHHIFGGANRKHSEQYGLKVYLCIWCHKEGAEAVHKSKKYRIPLQEEAQEAFESAHGCREDFRQIFGKNYL